MAKNNKTFWAAAGVIITVVLIAAGMYGNFVWAQADVKAADTKIDEKASDLGEKIKTVKTEGCLPARTANTSVKVLESRFDSMEKIQTTRHTEIMSALKPTPP